MEILKDYANLLREIDHTKDQIKLAEYELKWWLGVDASTGEGIPFDSLGVFKHGLETSMIQTEKKRKVLNKLNERLDKYYTHKERIEEHMRDFEGLDHKVAYLKYIKNMTLQEIADELGYSYSYIKKVSMKISQRNQEGTDILKTV